MKLAAKTGPRGDRVMIYGTGGVGKTTFAARAPRKAIWVCGEDGLTGLRERPDCLDLEGPDIVTTLAQLRGSKAAGYGAIVIDSIDWLDARLVDLTCIKNHLTMGSGSDSYYAWQQGPKLTVELHRQVIAHLECAWREGVDILVVAHSEVATAKSPTGADYLICQPKIGGKPASALWREWCDSVLLAEIAMDVHAEKRGGTAKMTTSGDRVLRCQPGSGYYAKSRYNGMPEVLPLSWAAYAAARDATLTSPDDLLAEAAALVAQVTDEPTKQKAAEHLAAVRSDPQKVSSAITRLRSIVAAQEKMSAKTGVTA